MARESIGLSGPLLEYLRRVGSREDADLAALRTETAGHKMAMMQIGPEQGQLMALLVKMIGAKRTLEIGVFTGYSAMAVAKAMGPNGRIVALDVSEEFTAVARGHWAKAGIADRIDLRLAPAAVTLQALLASGGAGSFDFAFIDADKTGYDTYYEYCLQLVRAGGLIAIDNVLWGGSVIDPKANDADTAALKALNEKIAEDPRVAINMIPIGDGLTLALKL